MNMSTKTTTVYVGCWDQSEYVYALSSDEAIASVKEHFAYGDPSNNDYAVGNIWASDDNELGWRINEMLVEAQEIEVEIKSGGDDETGHVVWSCPICSEVFSDDWKPDDKLPVLLMCGCDKRARFLLGVQGN